MDAEEQSQQWQEQSEPVFARIAQWRKEHPHATMAEIERAVDEQMNQLRAQVLQEVAQKSPIQQESASQTDKPRCPDCGVSLQARGQRKRRLQTQGGQQVTLNRIYLACPRCGYGLFPPG